MGRVLFVKVFTLLNITFTLPQPGFTLFIILCPLTSPTADMEFPNSLSKSIQLTKDLQLLIHCGY